MEALRARTARQSLLLVAVAAAHVLVIALLIRATRSIPAGGAGAVPISAVLLLPARRRPVRFTPARLHPLALSAAPITAPITVFLPPVSRPIHVPRPINWVRAARQAVHAILNRARPHTIGFPRGARARTSLSSAPSGVRSQGRESYRTRTGESISRSGGNCYLVSGPPPLDATQVEREAQMSRVECSGSQRGPSPGNLFKSLPAYKRYHALPSAAYPQRRPPSRRKRTEPPGAR